MRGKVHRKIIMEGDRQDVREIVAICDAELLGKVFEEGEMVLDLDKYRSFYDGERVDEKGVAKMLEGAGNINLVGKKTIAAASKSLNINEKNVKKIGGVPHLQIYNI